LSYAAEFSASRQHCPPTDLVYLEKTEHDYVLEPDGEVHKAVCRAKGRCLSVSNNFIRPLLSYAAEFSANRQHCTTDLVYLEQTKHDNVLKPDGEVHKAVGRAKGRCLSGF
jgi:hypothetical protein